MKKMKMSATKPDTERRLVVVPLSMWMDDEIDAEVERSFDRESARMAQDETARCEETNTDDALDEDEIRGILEEMVDLYELKAAAMPDYVASVADVLSHKLKFLLDLIFVADGDEGLIASVSSDAVAKLHAISAAKGHKQLRADFDLAPDDELLTKPVSEWSQADLSDLLEVFVDNKGVQLSIIDSLASSTDALCCDRLLDQEEYEKRATRLRQLKRAEEEFEDATEEDASIQ